MSLFALSLHHKAMPYFFLIIYHKWVNGNRYFPLRVHPIEKEVRSQNGKVVNTKGVAFHLNICILHKTMKEYQSVLVGRFKMGLVDSLKLKCYIYIKTLLIYL